MEMFEVGPCENAFLMGCQIGQRFSSVIKSRLASDQILQCQLRPFAQSQRGQILINKLIDNHRNKFPRYWDELIGTAQGSQAPLIDIILINFRKEILPFIPKTEDTAATQLDKMDKKDDDDTFDDCSDVLMVSDSLAIAAHNEDANIALIGHTYLIKATSLANGQSFTAYTYAGELPSCAFGFNSHGLAFTLNSVPPSEAEIVAGAIGRNFVSRDLLEATSMDDALRLCSSS